jgi:hypothetical protein
MRAGVVQGRFNPTHATIAKLGALVLALAVLGSHATALADGDGAHAAAVARFEEGTRLVKQGDCEAAIPKFVESLKNEEGVGAHLNLADCYARTGATAKAWLEFKSAERFATLKRNDERREVAHNGAYALEPKLLRLTLTIPYVEGLEVRINGTPIERDLLASRQVAISPGPFKIEATASKKRPWIKTGSGAAGEVESVTLAFEDDPAALRAEAAARPAQDAPGAPPSTAQRTVGIVVGVAGLAAVAAGSAFGILAVEKKADLKQAFESNPNCTGGYPGGTCMGAARVDLAGRESTAFTFATVSTVLFIVGGVALASGATLFFTAPSNRKTTGAKLGPQLGAATRALLLGGTW